MTTNNNGLNWETLAQQVIPSESCYVLSVLAIGHRLADPTALTPVDRNGRQYPLSVFSTGDRVERRWLDLQEELEGIVGGYRSCYG